MPYVSSFIGLLASCLATYVAFVKIGIVGFILAGLHNGFADPDLEDRPVLTWEEKVKIRRHRMDNPTWWDKFTASGSLIKRDEFGHILPGQKHPETGEDLVIIVPYVESYIQSEECWFVGYQQPSMGFLEKIITPPEAQRETLRKTPWNIWRCADIEQIGDADTVWRYQTSKALPYRPKDIPMPSDMKEKMCKTSIWECETKDEKRARLERPWADSITRMSDLKAEIQKAEANGAGPVAIEALQQKLNAEYQVYLKHDRELKKLN